MNTYHKIQSVYKRDPETNHKTFLEGQWSLPEFDYLKNNNWIYTEKVDGTNIRIMFDGVKAWFGGKTDTSQMPTRLANKLAVYCAENLDIFFNTFDSIENIPESHVCMYCEGYGAGIQKGGKYRKDQNVVLLDVKIGSWWLKREDVESLGDTFQTDVVPIIGKGTLLEAIERVREGFTSNWGDFIAEGIVARPEVDLKSRNGDRLITKIKHKDFIR